MNFVQHLKVFDFSENAAKLYGSEYKTNHTGHHSSDESVQIEII